jgi:outer membrane lipoprotein
MKKARLIILACMLIISCVPVLRQELLKTGTFDVRLSELKQDPDADKGRLFILGGIIVKTTVIADGSLIEAIYVHADSRGYLRRIEPSNGRFLAIFKGRDLLDPVIFHEKREITLAGEFIGTQKGMIGEMEYVYPLFEIREIYLWEEVKERDYYYLYAPYYYPPWHFRYRYYDPWGWHY